MVRPVAALRSVHESLGRPLTRAGASVGALHGAVRSQVGRALDARRPGRLDLDSFRAQVAGRIRGKVGKLGQPVIPGALVGTGGMLIPNPKISPGAVLTTNIDDIKTPGWAPKHRHLLPSEKKQVDQAYGYTGPSSAVEYDHIISLELGGSNDITNIWPQPIDQARIKDQVEDWTLRQVLAGRMSLPDAQRGIARDWLAFAKSHGAPDNITS